MIPDFEKMNERMEQASLEELMPGFNKENEWLQLSQKLHTQKTRRLIPIWSYAAAVLLLIAGSIWFTTSFETHDQKSITKQNRPEEQNTKPIVSPTNSSVNIKPAVAQSDPHQNENKPEKNKNAVAIKKHSSGHKPHYVVSNYTAKDFICNGTPCPLQICINQTMQCPDVQPATISSCSTLEPDQSGQLTYKAHDKIAKNCSLTINEIEITSIATGETILLNASSTPSTAQDVFSYITGQKKGDIIAGMFNSDCNHKTKKHGLRLNNSYGDLIIQ